MNPYHLFVLLPSLLSVSQKHECSFLFCFYPLKLYFNFTLKLFIFCSWDCIASTLPNDCGAELDTVILTSPRVSALHVFGLKGVKHNDYNPVTVLNMMAEEQVAPKYPTGKQLISFISQFIKISMGAVRAHHRGQTTCLHKLKTDLAISRIFKYWRLLGKKSGSTI